MNAVVDALHRAYGIRNIDMPATPLRIWEAIQAAKALSIARQCRRQRRRCVTARERDKRRRMNPGRGIALKIASTFVFTLMSVCVKLVADRVPAGEIVFARSFFALIPVVGDARSGRGSCSQSLQDRQPVDAREPRRDRHLEHGLRISRRSASCRCPRR